MSLINNPISLHFSSHHDEVTQPVCHHGGSHGWSPPSCKLMELWETSKASGLFHAVLCFTDSVLQPFFVLLEYVFTPRTRLCLYIHNVLTSIKLWHFSQITWAAISCFNTLTPKSMWVKDTIRGLSTKSAQTWDILMVEEEAKAEERSTQINLHLLKSFPDINHGTSQPLRVDGHGPFSGLPIKRIDKFAAQGRRWVM